MEKVCVTVSMEEERLKALEFALKKKNSSVQCRMDDALRQLYEKEVPEPIREYVDSLLAPPPRSRRPVRAAKAAEESSKTEQILSTSE